MKKVLFIAYLYPPIANSGTRRSLEFVNHLPDYGWEPIVLTVANPLPQECEPSLLDEVRLGTRIDRVPLWSDLLADKASRVIGGLEGRQRITDGLKWRIRRLLQVPDECAAWRRTAVRRAEEIFRQEGFDAIYASGWPWTSFMIAAEVSQKVRRPFVVDYRDLWKPSGVEWDKHTPLQQYFHPRLEKKVLRTAAAVVTTTASFARMLEEQGAKGKVFTITNGFDPDDFLHLERSDAFSGHDCVIIAYTGVWRPGYGPDDLYQAVKLSKQSGSKSIEKLKVITAGFAPGKAREYGVGDIVEELGRVSHDSAVTIMTSATMLYLPVSNGFYDIASIPGKLFEYLGSGGLILASAVPGSEVEAVLSSVGGAKVVSPGDVRTLATVIEKVCANGVSGLFTPRKSEAAAHYQRGRLTGKLAELLTSVSDSAG